MHSRVHVVCIEWSYRVYIISLYENSMSCSVCRQPFTNNDLHLTFDCCDGANKYHLLCLVIVRRLTDQPNLRHSWTCACNTLRSANYYSSLLFNRIHRINRLIRSLRRGLGNVPQLQSNYFFSLRKLHTKHS